MTFNELMQEYVDKSYEELVYIARSSYRAVLPAVEKYFEGEQSAGNFFIALIGACIGADGKLSEPETSFVRETVSVKLSDTLLDVMADVFGDEDSRSLVDCIVDSLESSDKNELCKFCTCLLAVDHTISHAETAFISKLFN